MATPPLPATMKALVLPRLGKPMEVQTLPTPTAIPGSLVVKVIRASISKALRGYVSGQAVNFTFPENMVPGGQFVGRVACTGLDTTSLSEGQLVLAEPFVRARDNTDVQILWGLFDGGSPASRKFMADNWAHGSFAEYCRVPLENVYSVDEARLCGSPADGGLGYTPSDLLHLLTQLVAYAGLCEIGLKAGETVIVAPATGGFSGAAVHVAVAMGATVIAMSRSVEGLQQLQATFSAGRVKIVPNTGDVMADAEALKKHGPIDAYIDLSPPEAKDSTHIRSCFMALRKYARVSLMGMTPTDVSVPYQLAMFQNLSIRGQYMYERHHVRQIIKLAETGVLQLGKERGCKISEYAMEEWEKALESYGNNLGTLVVIAP